MCNIILYLKRAVFLFSALTSLENVINTSRRYYLYNPRKKCEKDGIRNKVKFLLGKVSQYLNL